MQVRAEILVNGLVQGVGYRYFVLREAKRLDLNGFSENLFTGEVLTVVEGDRAMIEDLISKLKVGPIHAAVKNCRVNWQEMLNEFTTFEIR
jgi:acylphosphatase